MESEDKSGNVEECCSRFQTSGRRKNGGGKRQEKKEGRRAFSFKGRGKHTLCYITVYSVVF